MNVKEEWKSKGFIDAPVDESLSLSIYIYIYITEDSNLSL